MKKNIEKIYIDQPIIHVKYGIGIYKGLINLKISGIISEYLIILYENNDKLYVPISSIHLIQNYICKNIKNISLNKLGNKKWNKTTKNLTKQIYDTAALILKTQAVRSSKKGFSFIINKNLYKKFCLNFPFKFTLDQKKSIKSIFQDMQRNIPMDRLICGDVGFGKTEVAMHAAFLASSNNKQVVILVPTTLLAEQHYKNFLNRFKQFSIKIDMISSFRNQNKRLKIFKNIKNGKIKILIGTHALLYNNFKWKNLGLLIVDEEHRFGVYHKEKIKSYFKNIDVLTLTATPIPRTLNMALLGIRDLSIISTPPRKKISIKTFIKKYNNKTVRNAILKEINRNGQVFYIYNKIETIKKKLKKLIHLVPEANFYIAHGKMKKKKLKKIIKNFYNYKFNVLLCTTIIETGIDIPRANTILIENADFFGLSQLHQLRGRVGRSSKQAYAWFLLSKKDRITKYAKKRLNVISLKKNFDSGLSLAKKDLEVRGMGDILGNNQSGYLKNISFNFYQKLLNKAIINLKKRKKLSFKNLILKKPSIKLKISALIPANYINDVNIRLFFYQKINEISTLKKIKKIKKTLFNKFGKLPKFTKNLILIEEIKIKCKKIGIQSIKLNKKNGQIKFLTFKKINLEKFFLIITKKFDFWKLKKNKILIFQKKNFNNLNKAKWILKIVSQIYKKTY